MTPSSPRLAVLIDAENINASVAPQLIARVAELGRPTLCRAYGDWTTPLLTPWKKVLSPLAIEPSQHFRPKMSKNSSDAALIMDAMELIHGGKVEGICIVSCDCDYVGLATRIRRSGLLAYGFGHVRTNPAFVAACSEFVVVDELAPQAGSGNIGDTSRPASR